MRVEDITQYLSSQRVEDKNAATHMVTQPAMSLKVDDGADAQEQFAKFVYEANRLKDPIAVREVMTPIFALHFNIEIRGQAPEALVKNVAGAIGKGLSEYFPSFNDLTTVIYQAKLDDMVKSQVVFPDLLVDVDRTRMLRTAIVEHLTQKTNIGTEIQKAHPTNDCAQLIKEVDSRNGIEVPLGATTRIPMATKEAPLNPLAVAKISKQAVSPLAAPNDRFQWVAMGLKRRDQANKEYRTMTEWIEPRAYQKGPKGGEGSSGKSSGGSTGAPTAPRTGYSGGGDKHGK